VTKTVVYTRKSVEGTHPYTEERRDLIRSKFDLLATDPAALANNVRALHGSSSFRLRVGTWRVVFKTDAEHIRVVDVGPRGSIYD
jgi:mRNA interferase RelE/StbE